MVQTPLHAQLGPAGHHNLNSATMSGRASFSAKSGLQAMALTGNFTGGNHHNHLTSIHSQHHSSISSSNGGISASNYNTSDHHQNHHLGHHLQRNRHSSTTATAVGAVSLNSHFPHSHFSSGINLAQNSHHHHQLSLSSNSSAMSSASSTSSSPSASISPSSLTLSSPSSQLNLRPIGFHQLAGNTFGGVASHVIENSHHSSLAQQQPQQQNTSRYKTELCRPFEENGTCKYGEKCQFAHGLSELRTLTRHPKYKTEFCRTFHTTGFCPYGPRCHFIHNSKMPPTQAQLGLSSYSKLPFGHNTSHSASPSTSPISSTSSAATTGGSLSSSESTTSSSSPPSSGRLLDVSGPGFSYGTIDVSSQASNSVGDFASFNQSACPRKNQSEDMSQSSPCASDTQRLFWLHSYMNEGSRWPPAMCAGGLMGSSSRSTRRTWQMQA